jgi:exonuclease VII small subunit
MFNEKQGSDLVSTYRIEFMAGEEGVKSIDLEDVDLEEAVEVAQAGMAQYRANFARIIDERDIEVWNGRSDAPQT